MNRYGQKGSITIFLSLTCILFLSLICAVVESARVQGARAQTANITGMGTFSLMGEFERELLEKYEIFALDGTYGNGSFQIQKVNDRLYEFLSCNADPGEDIPNGWCFDPWNLELYDSKVSGYALLTDQKGESFYQQAVSYMKANIGVIAVDELLDLAGDAGDADKWQKQYEKNKQENDSQISGLEGEKQQRVEQLESEAEAEALENGTTAVVPAEPENNPLKEIAKLCRKTTLEIVAGDKEISDKSVRVLRLPSRQFLKKGTMKLEKEHSGMVSDVLFREYLIRYFPNFLSEEKGKGLEYQLEYILGGRSSDKANMKYVAGRLLLLREGMNYLYCLQDQQIQSQAGSLALTLTAWLGLPAVTEATKHALLLAWAYAESLIDVRILLDKGKVPLAKDASTWALPLENLGRITEILEEGAKDKGRGLSYQDYLRILLYLGSRDKQKMRGLDMMQSELQQSKATESFKAENCIVGVQTETKWGCGQVFLGLPQVVMGLSSADVRIAQKGSVAY